jgi:hypothetical protein
MAADRWDTSLDPTEAAGRIMSPAGFDLRRGD